MQTITVDRGVMAYMSYHKANSRPNSQLAFGYTLKKFRDRFSGVDFSAIQDGDLVGFLDDLTSSASQSTKHTRVAHVSALFNFVADTFDLDLKNPCSRGLIKKLYKKPRHTPPELLDKEFIDEMIYRSDGMDRLMLLLMGRAAMRVGEVLQIRAIDLNIEVNTITIQQPKSGRQGEVACVSQKIMRKLNDYVLSRGFSGKDRIFPISYATARRRVVKMGKKLGVEIRPHDLRRHAATDASRSGVPLEFVSKVILRHADISTTQRYLGQVSLAEASRVIENWLG